ncbi:MAG: hypothetical protein H7A25_05145 [Leptospiraceae bacterium]|nr:hypothetical protein [Leptospiraceae bacterium]MCP5499265.1 hypothetical protein [Leptospiraceae bacterium]
MFTITKFLFVSSFLVVGVVLSALFLFNPHPNSIKSDREYADSKSYQMNYSLEEKTPSKPLLVNKNSEKKSGLE